MLMLFIDVSADERFYTLMTGFFRCFIFSTCRRPLPARDMPAGDARLAKVSQR